MIKQNFLSSRRQIFVYFGRAAIGALLAQTGVTHAQNRTPEITILAASDLQFVLPELVQLYDRSDLKISLRFGASGTLATQIIRGLPCDGFLSADAAQVEKVQIAGLAAGEPFMYARGHIALAAKLESTIGIDDKFSAAKAYFERELMLGKYPKLAIANPLHAPYGAAAQQALETLGLWEFFKPHLVLGENIAQTAQFVASGSAVAGVIGTALCRAPALSKIVRCMELSTSLYKPIRQTAVLVKNPLSTSNEASKFLLFLKSEKATALLSQYGFSTSAL